MSADRFVVCYGLRWIVSAQTDEDISVLEEGKDPRFIAAKTFKLDISWDKTTDEERFFLLVGRIVGSFGWECKEYLRLDSTQMQDVMRDTREKLQSAGLTDEPAWHFQFQPDF